MSRKLLFFFGLLALLASGCVPPEKVPAGRGIIRVAVLQGTNAVTLSARSVLSVKDARSGKVLSTARHGSPVTVRPSGEGVRVGGTAYHVQSLQVTSTSNRISLNGKAYPGSLRIVRRPGGLLAVNLVDLDTYLKAVVPSEVSPTWPMEALKAQAVVSRSFVLFHALRNNRKDYDISSAAQVYNPDNWDRRTSKAVDATKNAVLFYKGDLLLSYFCTSCGGFTEYAANVWQPEGRFPPPVQCPFCRGEPGYTWTARMTSTELRRKLQSAGIAGARSIAVHRRSASGGRITALKVDGDGGHKILRINRFRMIMGPNVIRSGFFTIQVKGDHVVFSGRGWGHGVGMCQRGAKVMAEGGKSFRSILRHYFPGTSLKRMRW